ncbi:MAG: septum formation initiator family protein [Clostridia bacterium]|nr:septum formation initiator family protein [Clostridia bacterium]
MTAKRKRKKSVILRLLVLCVSVYMIVTLTGLFKTLDESQSKLNKLQEKYRTELAQVEELKVLLEEGSQSAIVEKAARERLGYVYSDEEIYIDISGN